MMRARSKFAPPKTKEELKTYIPHLVNRLSNRWTINQNRDLSEHGISNVILRTLSVLHIYKRLTVNEIAVLAVTDQPTASRAVDAMAVAGWVKREIAADDLRRRVVAPTRRGEAILTKIWPIVGKNYAKLVAGIAPDDLDVCARVLARMVENIRQHAI